MSKKETGHSFAALAVTMASLMMATVVTIRPAKAKGDELPAYSLRQVSQTYGPIEATVSSAGLRMTISTCIVTMPMPCDNMMFRNTRTRYYFEQTVKRFKDKIPNKIPPHWDQRVVYIDSGKIVGLPVKHYRWEKWNRKTPDEKRPIYDFWVTRSLKLPKQVAEVANICTYLPVNYGFPLKITSRKWLDAKRWQDLILLNTQSIKKITASRKNFVSDSTGFERVNSEMAVLLKERTGATEEDVSDLFKPTGMK